MIEIGRLSIKTAGRDAGLKCVIVDILDDRYVFVDGETRRRKCNVMHLEPLKEVLKIKKGASHEEVKKELEKIGINSRDSKPKLKTQKPLKKRKTSEEIREQKQEKKKLKEATKVEKKESGQKKAENLEEMASSEKEKTETKMILLSPKAD